MTDGGVCRCAADTAQATDSCVVWALLRASLRGAGARRSLRATSMDGGPTALEGDGAAPTRQHVGTPRPAPGTEEPALPASANAPAPRAPGRPARRRRVRLPREGNRSDGFRSVRGSGLKSSVPISIGSEFRIEGWQRATGVGFHQMAGPARPCFRHMHHEHSRVAALLACSEQKHSLVTLT